MSYYSGGEVKSKIIDPVNDITNLRSEFRLDNIPCMLTRMRLINIGLTGTSSVNNDYNLLTGSYGIIKNIRLMDGATELSSLRECSRYLGFKNSQFQNAQNQSIYKLLSNSRSGYIVAGNTNKQGFAIDNNTSINTTSSTTNKGHLDLRFVLPLLRSVTSLNNQLFPKLRLVIEYDTSSFKTRGSTFTNNSVRPSLVIDEVVDDSVINSEVSSFPKNTNWLEIEHDSFIVPEIPDASLQTTDHQKQQVTNKVNGFNNKNLQRLVVMKNDSNVNNLYTVSNLIVGVGNEGSLSQYKQKINYVVNGRNIMVGNGAETDAQRSAMLVDSWDDLNVISGSNRVGTDFEDDSTHSDELSQRDYDGVYIGSDIKDFQVNFEREVIRNGGNQSQSINSLVVNLYGEVMKNLSVKGNEYVVSYA